MMYTLNIDNGVEVELEHDLNHMLHGFILCFAFRIPQKPVPVSFILPSQYDELILFLFDVSRKYTIDYAFRHVDPRSGLTILEAYEFHIVTSTDHQTNITPEFMVAITKWKELLS